MIHSICLPCLALLQAVPAAPAPAPAPTAPAASQRGLAIVAPAAFRPALEPLIAARALEMPVEFAALEDLARGEVGADGTRVDPPEAIKRALFARWKAGTLGYVLLVGDADTFPVRFMVLDRATPAAANYAFYASDLYYADLAREDGTFDDWNGTRDGFHERYFGEVRGESWKQDPINYDRVSYSPEIAVGRFPVHSAEETAVLVKKTLAHARRAAPGTSTAPRALLVHADGWIDARARVRTMAAGLAARGFRVDTQIYGDEAGTPGPTLPAPSAAPTTPQAPNAPKALGAAGPLSPAPGGEVVARGGPRPERTLSALQDGTDLALHLGHGTEQGWHGCLGPAEHAALFAAPAAVYLSIGCSTAHFVNEPPYQAYLDELGVPHRGTNAGETFDAPPPPPHWLQPGAFDSSGFGPELVRAPLGGAVVYIGCATGAQPCALTLLDAFQEALSTDAAPRVGDAWKVALQRYVERERLFALVPNDDWYPPSIFFQGMKFVFLGDPTLVL